VVLGTREAWQFLAKLPGQNPVHAIDNVTGLNASRFLV
jgi:hypothetical protein